MKDYLLISNTNENKISNNYLDIVSKHIKNSANEKIAYKELSFRKAYQWELPSNKYDIKLKKIMTDFQSNHGIDCNFIIETSKRKKKLLLADMDSTIIKEESLDELAKQIGKEKEVSLITNEAMNGRLDFKKALKKRVAILKGNTTDILETIKKNVNINDGAKELVKTMNENGSITVLVSGGFTFLTEHLKDTLNFTYSHANTLQIIKRETRKFEITGKVEEPILDKNAKLQYLNNYVKKYNLIHDDTICVGDGANDIEMIKHAGIGVSFYGKTALNNAADIHFNNTNLLGLLYVQGYTDKDIIN
jgi:phosphoserine phosphatase